MKTKWMTWSFLFLSLTASAERSPQLTEALRSQILSANQSFQLACQTQGMEEREEDSIELKRFFLGLTATGTFGIQNVLDLSVSPEITLIWEKTELSN